MARKESVKGWRRDSDDWLVRLLRPGDAPESFWQSTVERYNPLNCHGFICEGKVYAREPEHARTYDAAAT